MSKAIKNPKVTKAVKAGSKAEPKKAEKKEVKTSSRIPEGAFKSPASGKVYPSAGAYLDFKNARLNTKASKLFTDVEKNLSKNPKEYTLNVKRDLGIDYVAPALVRIGIKALVEAGRISPYFIRDPKILEKTKSDNSGGKTPGLVEVTFVRK